MSNRGKFIVFEGIDGSGKTTQIKKLIHRMQQLGIPAKPDREPTDGDIGTLLRQYLKQSIKTDGSAIAALFAADRIDHITKKDGILDTLDSGVSVLCDRYYLSSYAYQSIDYDLNWIMELNRMAYETARPDIHIFLDVPADVSMERVKRRGETELYEVLERQKRIRDNFFMIFDKLKEKENILVLDGTKPSYTIATEVWNTVSKLYK